MLIYSFLENYVVLCYIAVDAFGFHQSYLLCWWKRTELSYVFDMENACCGRLPYYRNIAYSSCASSSQRYIVSMKKLSYYNFVAELHIATLVEKHPKACVA
ncbi:hypothetical protein SFRURICE_000020 [Spodoptera frugiperda]|nr:hypothetical protein SFRURICE_000020 [Spodoptera frugiperda]